MRICVHCFLTFDDFVRLEVVQSKITPAIGMSGMWNFIVCSLLVFRKFLSYIRIENVIIVIIIMIDELCAMARGEFICFRCVLVPCACVADFYEMFEKVSSQAWSFVSFATRTEQNLHDCMHKEVSYYLYSK